MNNENDSYHSNLPWLQREEPVFTMRQGGSYPVSVTHNNTRPSVTIRARNTQIDSSLEELIVQAGHYSRQQDVDLNISIQGGSLGSPSVLNNPFCDYPPRVIDTTWEENPYSSYHQPCSSSQEGLSKNYSYNHVSIWDDLITERVVDVVLGLLGALAFFLFGYVWHSSITGKDPIGDALKSFWNTLL